MMTHDPHLERALVAYFSMEVALENHIPNVQWWPGRLAGDTLRSAADLGLAMVGVTLLHRKGYFFQRFDAEGCQHEEPVAWPIDDLLQVVDGACVVEVERRTVTVRAWRYEVRAAGGSSVPVLLLDTDVPDKDFCDRRLTDHLYAGDDRYRLCQELILGVGGVRMLCALGYHRVARFHMNEGHSLLALELFAEEIERVPADRAAGLGTGGEHGIVGDVVVTPAGKVLRRVGDVGIDPQAPVRIDPETVRRPEDGLIGRDGRVVVRIAGEQEDVP
jgi:glucan phosphorylase